MVKDNVIYGDCTYYTMESGEPWGFGKVEGATESVGEVPKNAPKRTAPDNPLDKSTRSNGRQNRRYSITLERSFWGQTMRLEHLRNGMSMVTSDILFENDTVAPFQVGEGAVAVTIVLSGVTTDNSSRAGGSEALEVRGPCERLHYSAASAGEMRFKGGAPLRSVAVCMSREHLLELIQDDETYKGLAHVLHKGSGLHLLANFSLSPVTRMIASQIRNCTLTGPCRRLYLEAKALELLSGALQQMGERCAENSLSLCRRDVELIHEARHMLLQDIETPPSIRNLALMTGINECKLKKGFKKIFGKTIYQTLRDHRMQFARKIIEDTNMNIGMVASIVGYTNMSHFIRAFRDHFGVTPGSLLRHMKLKNHNHDSTSIS